MDKKKIKIKLKTKIVDNENKIVKNSIKSFFSYELDEKTSLYNAFAKGRSDLKKIEVNDKFILEAGNSKKIFVVEIAQTVDSDKQKIKSLLFFECAWELFSKNKFDIGKIDKLKKFLSGKNVSLTLQQNSENSAQSMNLYVKYHKERAVVPFSGNGIDDFTTQVEKVFGIKNAELYFASKEIKKPTFKQFRKLDANPDQINEGNSFYAVTRWKNLFFKEKGTKFASKFKNFKINNKQMEDLEKQEDVENRLNKEFKPLLEEKICTGGNKIEVKFIEIPDFRFRRVVVFMIEKFNGRGPMINGKSINTDMKFEDVKDKISTIGGKILTDDLEKKLKVGGKSIFKIKQELAFKGKSVYQKMM